jgi:CHAT domain-containing protein
LPGSAAEIQRLLALAGSRRQVVLAREQATWSKLRVVLPQARFAHLATHGFFQATALSHEEQRLERQRKTWEFQADRPTARVGLGLRSPLSYTGLVLAGANRPSAAEDGGLVTGEDLVELPLEGLRLCVLSACETGLGDLGPLTGEGAQGLERAFHLAGCPNVIASRWQVDDQATAALMAKFYHELWTNGKSPLAALREAQLTILRHPERIAVLANRAAPNTGTVIRLSADGPAPRRAPTKLWAAFVLSGVGQ